MTVHQLHYTSCEDGLEGIRGFQISAVTPGAPKPLVELAVRASVYEVGPNLLSRLGASDLSDFPIAFGYVPSGSGAALFQSRYTGADFTGRMGNYFAHALLLEDVERELGDVLPIDLWRSPDWVYSRQNGTALPTLTGLAPGAATDIGTMRQFLAAPGRLNHLEGVITAAQRVLAAHRGRLVLIAQDDEHAALWVAALCRSLPRPLGLGVSFVTYTSRPEDSEVLVSCTLPDVRLPSYGDFTTVDTTAPGVQDGDTTRYARTLGTLWESDGVAAAIELVQQAHPPLIAADLEAYAVLLGFRLDNPDDAPVAEALLIDAVCLAVDRIPGALTADGWQRIGDLIQDRGGLTDLTRWSEVLRSATLRREPVPANLLGTYFIAALIAPQRVWVPPRNAGELEDIAEHTVLPMLTSGQAGELLKRLEEQRDLLSAVVRTLDRRLADDAELRRLAATLTPQASQLLHRVAGTSPRLGLLNNLVLARNGQGDPVTVLARAAGDPEVEWRNLGSVLWPDELSTEDASRALKGLPADVLRETGLFTRIAQDLLRRAERDELTAKEGKLTGELLGSPLKSGLQPGEVTVLTAAHLIVHFRLSAPKRGAEREVWEGLQLLGELPEVVGVRLQTSIATFIMRASGATHRELLDRALDSQSGPFLAAYRELARAELARVNPNHAAPLIVIWRALPDARIRKQLLEKTLPAALARRRRKHLDKIGALLESAAEKVGVRGQTPKGGWLKWWQTWRAVHERRGLLRLLGFTGRR
jgi:GTPase-associated protein 1, N-terminal domain type 2/GTPase-associated protein 1, middle domain